jgi:hypothetical protein
METKEYLGSERVRPDRGAYLAIERVRQGALWSHPKGKSLTAPCVVKGLDRGQAPLFALLLAQHPAGTCHGPAGSEFGPSCSS